MQEDRRSSRRVLTDKALEKIKPQTKPFDIWDEAVHGLSARVHPSGKISFTVMVRRARGVPPTRRTLGRYISAKALGVKDAPEPDERAEFGEGSLLTLAEARVAAKTAINVLRRGQDPKEMADEKRAHDAERRAATLESAVEAWLAEVMLGPNYRQKRRGEPRDPAHKPLKTSGPGVAADMRRKIVAFKLKSGKRLGDVPMSEVTAEHLMAAINADKRHGGRHGTGAPGAAGELLGHVRRCLDWAIHTEEFGLKVNPIKEKRASMVTGPKLPRDRVLWDPRSDDDPGAELRLFWRATERLPESPWRAAYRLAILTGGRRANLFGLTRAHIKLDSKRGPRLEWPKAEMKSNRKAPPRDFWLPLPPAAVALLASLPDLPDGPYLLSGSLGKAPASGFSRAQRAIKAAMLAVAQEDAVARGDDPSKVKVRDFRLHDVRRTFRTILGEIGTPEEVAELLIAHVPPRLVQTYEVDARLDQKAEAMRRYGARLATIIEPPPVERDQSGGSQKGGLNQGVGVLSTERC